MIGEQGQEIGAVASQQPTTGEALARRFHEIYERRAPEFGYETRKETRDFDPTTPNGRLMIAVCTEIADAHNAALTAERERVKTANYWEAKEAGTAAKLREQLAAERETKK